MESKVLQKYSKKSLSTLLNTAKIKFNLFIRERDKDKPCVSCGQYKLKEAGHFYSAGHYPELRFNEDNVHGQCNRCNRFLHGNLNEYRKRITHRITEEGLTELDNIVSYHRRNGYKWDRISIIEIITKY